MVISSVLISDDYSAMEKSVEKCRPGLWARVKDWIWNRMKKSIFGVCWFGFGILTLSGFKLLYNLNPSIRYATLGMTVISIVAFFFYSRSSKNLVKVEEKILNEKLDIRYICKTENS